MVLTRKRKNSPLTPDHSARLSFESNSPPDLSAAGHVRDSNVSPGHPQRAPQTTLARLYHQLKRCLRQAYPHRDPSRDSPGLPPPPAPSCSSISVPVASYDPSAETGFAEPGAKRVRLDTSSDRRLRLSESGATHSPSDATNAPLGQPSDPSSTSSTSPSPTPWDALTPAQQELVRVDCQKLIDEQRQLDPEMQSFFKKNVHIFFRALKLNYTHDASNAWSIVLEHDLWPVILDFRIKLRDYNKQCTPAVAELYYDLANHGTPLLYYFWDHLCLSFA